MPRFLHFTDMHLRHHQPGSASNPMRLSRLMPVTLEQLGLRIGEHKPDVTIMTGDLLDIPHEMTDGENSATSLYAQLLAKITADYQLVKNWFEGTGIPYLVIPGNHDHEPTFEKIFGNTRGPRDLAGFRFFSFWDRLGTNRQPERVGASADLFHTALNAPENDCPQIHLQHYMIDPPTRSNGWQYEYKGAAKMNRAVEQSCRVRAVLSGHYHPGSLVNTIGGVTHSLPPAFCEAPHIYRIYDFNGDKAPVITDFSLDT
ncbi:MAG: hypothetical protein CMF69_07375 [Magnetovibrio sp.]|nr:hypothetical protein [Magnetovibrio sp.]